MTISESSKASQFEESVIRGMTRLCRQYNGVNLSQGFPDFPAPLMIKEAAKKAISGKDESRLFLVPVFEVAQHTVHTIFEKIPFPGKNSRR